MTSLPSGPVVEPEKEVYVKEKNRKVRSYSFDINLYVFKLTNFPTSRDVLGYKVMHLPLCSMVESSYPLTCTRFFFLLWTAVFSKCIQLTTSP